MERDRPHVARLRDLRARHGAATFVVGFARLRAEQLGAGLVDVETWAPAAQRFAERAAKAIGRAA